MQSAGQPAPPDSVCESVKNSSEGKEPSRAEPSRARPSTWRAERRRRRWRGDSEPEQKALGEEGESGYVK